MYVTILMIPFFPSVLFAFFLFFFVLFYVCVVVVPLFFFISGNAIFILYVFLFPSFIVGVFVWIYLSCNSNYQQRKKMDDVPCNYIWFNLEKHVLVHLFIRTINSHVYMSLCLCICMISPDDFNLDIRSETKQKRRDVFLLLFFLRGKTAYFSNTRLKIHGVRFPFLFFFVFLFVCMYFSH